MKSFGILFVLFFAVYPAENGVVGINKCTWGISYVCKDISTANSCDMVQQCRANFWTKPIQDDEVCEICKEGMKLVDSYLEQNGTKPEIKSALLKICADIPIATLSSECKELVNSDFDMIYDELLMILSDGSVVCSAMGLCTSVEGRAEQLYIMENHLSVMIKEAYENNQLPVAITVITDDTSMVENSYCTHCHAFIGDVQRVIMNNPSTVKQWENLIKMECKDLSPGLIEVCEDSVSQLFPTILKALSSTNVDAVCNTIDMCGPGNNMVVKGSDDMCTDCKQFFEDWQDMIKNNQSIIESIEQLVTAECKHLKGLENLHDLVKKIAAFYCLQKPSDLQKECVHYVSIVIENNLKRIENECENLASKYLSSLWQLIAETSPEETCTAIYFCDEKMESNLEETKNSLIVIEEEAPFLDTCSVCEEIVKVLDKELAKNSTVAEIEDFLKKVCGMLPANLESDCDMLVDEYGPQIIELIIKGATPKELCSKLGLCTSLKVSDPNTYCTDCTAFMKDLQNIARNNQSIVDDLTSLIKDQCDQLGPEISELCKLQISTVVKNLLPQFCNLDVNTICSTILMCTSSPKSLLLKAKDDDVCTHCTKFFQDWQEIIQNNQSTIDQLNSLIAEQCNSLGPDFEKLNELGAKYINLYCDQLPFLQSECKEKLTNLFNQLITTAKITCDAFVKDYLPQLWNLISENDAEEICSTLYLCDFVENVVETVKPIIIKEKVETPVSDSVTCELCKVVINELVNLLEGNTTQASIENALEKVCSLLSADISAECKMFVDKYGDEVIDLIINEVESADICTKLKLCSSKEAISEIKSSTTCTLCMDVVKYLDSELEKNSTQAQIEQALEKVCDVLPSSVKSECISLVEQYGPLIIDLLANELSPTEVCSKLGLCSSAKKELADNCALCTEIAGVLENLLEENSTEAEITAALEKVCTILPSSVESECKALIEQYGSEIIKILLNYADPKKICTELGLCKSIEEVPFLDTCSVCEEIVKVLDKELAKNSTVAEIEDLLKKVCGMLPANLESDCDMLVDEYGPQIIELIIKGATPKELCSKLGLCTSLKVNNPVTCALCKVVIHELDELLEGNTTSAAIENALEKVCSVVPASYSAECKMFINKYGKEVIDMIINEVESGAICPAMMLCSSKPTVVKIKSSTTCTLCMDVVKYLDSELEKNSTQAQIEQALEKVCDVLPSSVESECISLVEQYGPLIIDLLANELSPTEVCSKLDLCSSAKKELADNCALCTEIAGVLENLLEENSTQAEITAALEKVCTILPSSVESECKALIEQYGSEIIKILLNYADPKKICTELGLCKSIEEVPFLDTCSVCEEIVKVLDNELAKNSTVAEIEDLLKKVCGMLPANLESDCDMLVDEYGPQFVELIIKGAAPKEMCSKLGLCTSFKAVKTDGNCVLCKVVVGELDGMLSKNSTETEIINAVESVCKVLPSTIMAQCVSFIEDNGAALIELLIKQISPEKLCSELKLCKSVKFIAKNSIECEACHFIFEELSKVLTANSTEEEVIKEFMTVCEKISGALEATCEDLVEEYVPKILVLLANIDDPDYMCLHLELCPKVQMRLGANPCTFGPSHWCKNKQTAIECNALSHCMNHVWD